LTGPRDDETGASMTPDSIAALRQDAHRAGIDTLFDRPWILLYRFRPPEAWYSALVAADEVDRALSHLSWDIDWDSWRPGIVVCGSGEDAKALYQRFPRDGIEPLVHVRHRDEAPAVVEIAEELRLYLNLFSGEGGNLYAIGPSGDEDMVVRIGTDEVEILKAPLLRYVRARQMHLALYFDHQVWFEEERHNPLREEEREFEVAEPDRRWGFASSAESRKLFSRLCGKRLLAPPPLTARTVDEPEKRFVDFIIGYDQDGEPLEHSADPDSLANLFGANAGAPNYLAPVHFRRDVLDRYFQNPARFEVADGFVRCGSHWLIRMDDDHDRRVIAFLGDLGRDLPYSEQLHWRAHNVGPEGRLSRTARARSFEARFADGGQPEHRFKAAYARSTKAWAEVFGWPLFRPLASADRHILTKLHVPTSDNPAELDSQLLGLAKILVDSLNDQALDSAVAAPIQNERSLGKLDRFLEAGGYRHAKRDVALLRGPSGPAFNGGGPCPRVELREGPQKAWPRRKACADDRRAAARRRNNDARGAARICRRGGTRERLVRGRLTGQGQAGWAMRHPWTIASLRSMAVVKRLCRRALLRAPRAQPSSSGLPRSCREECRSPRTAREGHRPCARSRSATDCGGRGRISNSLSCLIVSPVGRGSASSLRPSHSR
jgi:hypothetical protein